MTDLSIIVGMIMGTATALCVRWHIAYLGRVTLLDWSLLAIGAFYGVGWALVLAVTASGNNPFWEPWILKSSHLFLLHTACAAILAGATWLGWRAWGGFFRRKRSVTESRAACHRNEALTRSRLTSCGWFMLLSAFAIQVIYSDAYGGLIGMIEFISFIRSGYFDAVPENQWSFLRPLAGLGIFASFVFFGLLLASPRRWQSWLGWILSLSFSCFLLFLWQGRIGFLAYLVTFVVGFVLYRERNPLRLILKGGLTVLGILVGAYYLSAVLELKYTEGLFNYIAHEIGFPFGSFFGHLSQGDLQYRWFVDFLVAPVYLLPSSVWSKWISDVGDINTILIMGASKGVAGVSGAVPVDLLTLGILQAPVVGIVGVGVLFGVLLRMLEGLISRIPHKGTRAAIEAYVAIKIAVLGVFYAQPALVVSGNSYLIAGGLLMTLFLALPRLHLSFGSRRSRGRSALRRDL